MLSPNTMMLLVLQSLSGTQHKAGVEKNYKEFGSFAWKLTKSFFRFLLGRDLTSHKSPAQTHHESKIYINLKAKFKLDFTKGLTFAAF